MVYLAFMHSLFVLCSKQHELLRRDIEVREATLQKLEAEINQRNLSLYKLRSASSELVGLKHDFMSLPFYLCFFAIIYFSIENA